MQKKVIRCRRVASFRSSMRNAVSSKMASPSKAIGREAWTRAASGRERSVSLGSGTGLQMRVSLAAVAGTFRDQDTRMPEELRRNARGRGSTRLVVSGRDQARATRAGRHGPWRVWRLVFGVWRCDARRGEKVKNCKLQPNLPDPANAFRCQLSGLHSAAPGEIQDWRQRLCHLKRYVDFSWRPLGWARAGRDWARPSQPSIRRRGMIGGCGAGCH